ncbi:MAG TPA: biotin/lipoyl-binding protein, partial [Gammaproteobacteria bacterium]|nr:biotin/lipoyl-binding protein [Gammaproteobacteria bacterium]
MMSNRSRAVILLALVLIVVVAIGWWFWFRPQPLPEGLIQANGRFEGDHYTVASRVPGRVVALLAREGDAVTRGQLLVRLDDARLRARLDQARQAVAA